jgi:predicted metal-dependent phosphoesterase TrpH/anti-sigma regulatory factor (Ser/Thr protein kinase)
VFCLDMHVHTCLSPCGELDMHPAAIARAAALAGLDGLVVCDHHAADNAAAVSRAGGPLGVAVVPGMEVTSEEEVHLVAILPDQSRAAALQARVAAELPGRNEPRVFGEQVIADEHADVLGFNDALLSGATRWSVERAIGEIHALGGLAVAAHVDRERFGMVGQLGFIPAGLPLDAIEVSSRTSFAEGRRRFAGPTQTPIVTGSDAHRPDDIGASVTFVRAERVAFDELRRALQDADGRTVLGGGRPMEDLALHILDVAQNSIEAGATRIEIEVVEDTLADRLVIEIRDDGRGMGPVAARAATDPFYTTRTTRRVGLGLPMLKQAAEAAGGSLAIRSEPGRGTQVTASFGHGHLDRAPLGDLETTLMVLVASHPEIDLTLTHRVGSRDFSLSSQDLRSALDGQAVTSPEGLALLREAIRRGEASLAETGPGREGPGGRRTA